METVYFWQVVAAVVMGNAFSFAFFMGAMKASRLQKKGAANDELPFWVYFCLLPAPLLIMWAGKSLTG